MNISFLRSSSYNCHEMCPMQYYLEYVLGWRGPANIKADKGTIVHKVLEILALTKKAKQEKKKDIKDDICGIIPVNGYDINKLVEQVFGYYAKHITQHNWQESDFKDCKNWVWKALTFDGGKFDPRKCTIVDAEPQFNIEISEPWAMYKYGNDSGFLRLKGTIDLIVQIKPKVYEIRDWKTGRRLNWATGEEKTHEKLKNDPQLRIYHYAAHHLYDVDQILVTIFYINDGGPFTVCYDKAELPQTLDMLKTKFEDIKNDTMPKRNRSWKCTKFCHQGKTTFEGTSIQPIKEFRNGHVCRKGQTMTKCEQVALALYRDGIEQTTIDYTHPEHTIGFYQDPGSPK